MTEYSLGDRGTLRVVTDDYYDEEILQVFEELHVDREKIWNGEARLVPEPDNPYEPNSIAVYIDEIKVGRLSPKDSAEYWDAICRVVASEYEPIAHLQISAVLRKIDNETYVESEGLLSLSPVHSLFPLNQTPTQAALLPQGPSMKVLDEKDYAEYLHSILPSSGEGRVILTLEANTIRMADGRNLDTIEVFHDRKKVGRLSTQMSDQLIPVVRYAFENNRLTSAWGTIRGNAFEISLTVQAVRAPDIPEEWYLDLPNNVPELVDEAESYEVPDAYVPTYSELHQQSAEQKKRQLIKLQLLETSSISAVDQGSVRSNFSESFPNRRLAMICGLIGALILVLGVVIVFTHPFTGILGIVLGASIVFLGLFMGRSPISADYDD